MPRIRAQLITFHALDDVRQRGIGGAREADLLALAYDEAVEEFDLRAPAFLDVLAHRGTLLGRGALAVLEALLVADARRRLALSSQPVDARSLPVDSRALARRGSLRSRAAWRSGESVRFATYLRRADLCRRRAHCPWHWQPVSTSARPIDCRLPWRCRRSRPGGKFPPPVA